jgi:hypothetical protein
MLLVHSANCGCGRKECAKLGERGHAPLRRTEIAPAALAATIDASRECPAASHAASTPMNASRGGGRIVRHNLAETFWTLADPAGNEVDVATTSAPDQAE